METSSRRIVEADITLTHDESERVAATQDVHELTADARTTAQTICKSIGGTCLLRSELLSDSKTGANTMLFRCVSDDDAEQPCAMFNGPYLACDIAADTLYKALEATPKK